MAARWATSQQRLRAPSPQAEFQYTEAIRGVKGDCAEGNAAVPMEWLLRETFVKENLQSPEYFAIEWLISTAQHVSLFTFLALQCFIFVQMKRTFPSAGIQRIIFVAIVCGWSFLCLINIVAFLVQYNVSRLTDSSISRLFHEFDSLAVRFDLYDKRGVFNWSTDSASLFPLGLELHERSRMLQLAQAIPLVTNLLFVVVGLAVFCALCFAWAKVRRQRIDLNRRRAAVNNRAPDSFDRSLMILFTTSTISFVNFLLSLVVMTVAECGLQLVPMRTQCGDVWSMLFIYGRALCLLDPLLSPVIIIVRTGALRSRLSLWTAETWTFVSSIRRRNGENRRNEHEMQVMNDPAAVAEFEEDQSCDM